jgi:hypothetical protein
MMPSYLLHHVHDARECGVAFASFAGDDSPLRRRPAVSSCRFGGHEIWWVVSAPSDGAALALLPYYIAQRTTAIAVADVEIP